VGSCDKNRGQSQRQVWPFERGKWHGFHGLNLAERSLYHSLSWSMAQEKRFVENHPRITLIHCATWRRNDGVRTGVAVATQSCSLMLTWSWTIQMQHRPLRHPIQWTYLSTIQYHHGSRRGCGQDYLPSTQRALFLDTSIAPSMRVT